MESIPKAKLKLFLIILIIFLIILVIIQLADNTLYLRDVKREVINTFGKDYTINIHKINKSQLVVLATISENLYIEMDYTEKVNQLKDSPGKYKIDLDKINKITLLVGYHTEDTKHIISSTDIDLSSISLSN